MDITREKRRKAGGKRDGMQEKESRKGKGGQGGQPYHQQTVSYLQAQRYFVVKLPSLTEMSASPSFSVRLLLVNKPTTISRDETCGKNLLAGI